MYDGILLDWFLSLHTSDFQACADHRGELWLHHCLLQPSVHAEAENQHPAVRVYQGRTRLHHRDPVLPRNHRCPWASLPSFSFSSLGFDSHPRSPPSRKYLAARTSSPTLLCVFLWAATFTSLPWKAHVCLRASWPLALGESTNWSDVMCKKGELHTLFESECCHDLWFLLFFLICRMLVSIGESFGVCASLLRFITEVSDFLTCFCFLLSVCSCLIGFRRSTRWSTAGTAPSRGVWTWAPLQNL